jgi:hypothetical protein
MRYTVIFGGAAMGSVTVGAPDSNFLPEIKVALHSPVPIQGLTMALAVNPANPVRKASLRRAPTPGDRTRAEQLARSIFRGRGVQRSAFSRMEINQITVMPLISDEPEILVSADIERPDREGLEYSLFFIARVDSDDAEVLWFDHPKRIIDSQNLYVVDCIDTDGDGVDELIAERAFYEDHRYEVYKYRNQQWTKIFETGFYNCVEWGR